MLFRFIYVLQYSDSKLQKNITPTRIRRILITGYMGIGNVVLFSPAIRAIRERFPKAHIALLVHNVRGYGEILRGSKLIDEIIEFRSDQTGIFEKLKFFKNIREKNFDLLISDFHGLSRFFTLLTIISNIPYRMGHVTSPGWDNKYSFVYNYKVKMDKNEHEIDRYLRLAYAVGVDSNCVNKKPIVCLNNKERNYGVEFWRKHGIRENSCVISVQIGTNPKMRWKQWDLDKYRKLCDRILELPNVVVILHGSPEESEMILNVARKMNNEPIIAAGKTNIKQAAAIIEKSDILICNDSGLMHVAVALDTSVIAIYGPTDYTRTAPVGKQHTIIRKDFECSPCFKMEGKAKAEHCPYGYKCLNSINVDEVFEVVLNKLKEQKKCIYIPTM